MMGSDYSNSQRLEFEKLMGINATSVLKLGETQQKIRDKIKEIRTETYLKGGTLHRLALMTAMGTLLKLQPPFNQRLVNGVRQDA